MGRLRKWLWFLGILAVLAGLGFLITRRPVLEMLIDYWWFSSLDYTGYFFLRLLYPYLVFVVVTIIFFLIFFFNFWIASRYLGTTPPPKKSSRTVDRLIYNDMARGFRTGSMKVYTPLSILLAILVAIPLYRIWQQTILWIFAPGTEDVGNLMVDPFYGIDISFYLFSYPVYLLIYKELLLVFSLLLVALYILYRLEGKVIPQPDIHMPHGAKIHLTILVILVLAIRVAGYILEQFGILYMNDPQTVFYGPGFVEIWFYLPLYWLKILLFVIGSVILIWWIHTRKGLKPLGIVALLFLGSIGLEHTSFIPNLINRYIVEPNEMAVQKPFIENNIKATLDSFALNEVEERSYPIAPMMTVTSDDLILQRSLRSIPVWDREVLDKVYEQRQGIRPYYAFTGVDVDRYTVDGLYQQVNLAAREISIRELPSAAQSWINERLQYTHGYGAVMTPAVQSGDEDMEWFIRNIPMASDLDYKITQPRLYYGIEKYQYAIAPNAQHEIDYPQQDGNALVDYQGEGGIPIDSLFRKVIFALYFRDKNILFTADTIDQSRMLIRRNIHVALEKLSPYLVMDSDPYVVVGPDRIYWIQDAYTTSNLYPYTEFYQGQEYQELSFNYIRNSVKIVMDAYNGDILFYISDPTDPVITAFSRMYPGVFKPIALMPEPIKSHIRYPQDFFDIQMSVFRKYHQVDPELFYRQEDHWEFASLETALKRSYYLTLNLLDKDRFEFLMLSPMSPISRQNLRTLMTVGCDSENYGRIVIYNFPKGQQVYGPEQVSSLIDNDDRISQELSLWDQQGSKIKRGRMIIFPVDNTLLYIQPVYLISTAQTQIPKLIRIIISQGTIVEMATNIQDAFAQLEARVRAKTQQETQRTYPTEAPPEELPEEETELGTPADDATPPVPEIEMETETEAPPSEVLSPEEAPTITPDREAPEAVESAP